MLEAILLGLVQGATEFLPISSSGHLVLIQHITGSELRADFDVFLHLGTLLATVTYFKREILSISSNYVRLIIIATLPAVIIGLIFQEIILSLFSSSLTVGIGLLLTTFVLISTKGKKGESEISPSNALIIGIAQSIAMIPGVSRSGATISTALNLGVKQSTAFTFSFIMSIPAILGATLLNFLSSPPEAIMIPRYAVGVFAAFISGYFALRALDKIIRIAYLHKFALYTFPLALFALLLL